MGDECPQCGWPAEPDELAPLMMALKLKPAGWLGFLRAIRALLQWDVRDTLDSLRE